MTLAFPPAILPPQEASQWGPHAAIGRDVRVRSPSSEGSCTGVRGITVVMDHQCECAEPVRQSACLLPPRLPLLRACSLPRGARPPAPDLGNGLGDGDEGARDAGEGVRAEQVGAAARKDGRDVVQQARHEDACRRAEANVRSTRRWEGCHRRQCERGIIRQQQENRYAWCIPLREGGGRSRASGERLRPPLTDVFALEVRGTCQAQPQQRWQLERAARRGEERGANMQCERSGDAKLARERLPPRQRPTRVAYVPCLAQEDCGELLER